LGYQGGTAVPGGGEALASAGTATKDAELNKAAALLARRFADSTGDAALPGAGKAAGEIVASAGALRRRLGNPVRRFLADEAGVMPAPNNPRLFPNQFPHEGTPPHRGIVAPSRLMRVRGAQWFDYVVLEDGSLVVGQRLPGQGHANLAQGGPVQAAGQV